MFPDVSMICLTQSSSRISANAVGSAYIVLHLGATAVYHPFGARKHAIGEPTVYSSSGKAVGE